MLGQDRLAGRIIRFDAPDCSYLASERNRVTRGAEDN